MVDRKEIIELRNNLKALLHTIKEKIKEERTTYALDEKHKINPALLRNRNKEDVINYDSNAIFKNIILMPPNRAKNIITKLLDSIKNSLEYEYNDIESFDNIKPLIDNNLEKKYSDSLNQLINIIVNLLKNKKEDKQATI